MFGAARDFPARHRPLLVELSTRLLDSRKPKTPLDVLARDVLVGFHAICLTTARDSILVALGHPDLADARALADDPALHAAVLERLVTIDIDGGGPRGVRAGQIADGVIAALGLTVVDDADRAIAIDGATKASVTAALAVVTEAGLAIPALRENVIATARARCDEHHLAAFDKLAAQLDERGMRVEKQPKVPLDAAQAVQRHLADARDSIIGSMATTAIDRVKDIIARTVPAAAARIDEPVTHTLTPRDVAIRRACDPRFPKRGPIVAESLLTSLGEVAHWTWLEAAQQARPYAASATFAVGELVEHPKFGRGAVISVAAQRMEVEFPSGKFTLVHRKS